jgi:hypothetical protein
MENIKKYQSELLELDVEHQKFLLGVKNGVDRTLVLFGDFHLSGLGSVMNNYYEKKFILEKKLRDEYIKLIVPISNSNVDVKVEIPLIDYNVPFAFVEDSGMNTIQPTGEDKIYFYFLTKQFSTFHELERIILTERGFFNQADVILDKGKARYRSSIKDCRLNLKFFNIIDGKGNVTAIGRSVKEIFDKVINSEEKMELEIYGKLSIHRLIGLIFNNIERIKEKDWLVNFDKVDKLETNLELLHDTYQKFDTRRDYWSQ